MRALADGRAYTGRQALQLGLVDAIGGEHDARDWLAKPSGVSAKLPVEDLSTGSFTGECCLPVSAGCLDSLWKSLFSQGVMLDGAWAIWQRSGG